MPDLEVVAVLCAAALIAGWVDAVVGGGGLVQPPALLVVLPGATPAQVLATKARIVDLATNVGALAVLVPQGAPIYGLGLAMAACNVVGVLIVRLAIDVARA